MESKERRDIVSIHSLPFKMVLSDLGRRINSAFQELSRVPTVDDKAVDVLLKTVCAALLESDVNVRLVSSLRDKVRGSVKERLNAKDKNAENMSEMQRKNVVQKVSFPAIVSALWMGKADFALC